LELGVHLFLDSLNNYGMGLLEPFNEVRIALHVIFVADPFFTLWPLLSVVMLLLLKERNNKRKIWTVSGIVMSAAYLLFAIANKINVESDFNTSLQNQGIAYERKLSTPTPFNNLLWFVTAGGKDGFYVGYRSIFDKAGHVSYHYFPRNEQLLLTVRNKDELQDLIRFSQGFYTVEKWGDTLVFNDLRFGQMAGWQDPKQRFVFHYFLDQPDAANRLVVQRGRFSGWNSKSLAVMWKRIKGEKY
jgi:inner membrane protein